MIDDLGVEQVSRQAFNDKAILFDFSVINNRNRRMPSVGSSQMLNSIQTKQVNKVKPNVNRPPIPDGVVVSPSSYNRYVQRLSALLRHDVNI